MTEQGGPVSSSGPDIVGEHGPERFVPASDDSYLDWLRHRRDEAAARVTSDPDRAGEWQSVVDDLQREIDKLAKPWT